MRVGNELLIPRVDPNLLTISTQDDPLFNYSNSSAKAGGPLSRIDLGKTASSSDRSGEGSSSPQLLLIERMQHWRSQGLDGSPPFSEETAVRLKRRCNKENRLQWIPKRLLLISRGNVQAALKAYAEEENMKRNNGTILKKGCLDDAKKLKPSFSGDRGKIEEDGDGHSNKKTSSAVEDEHHSGNIGVHAIEEHKQEQGSASGHVQALLDMDDETIAERIRYFNKRLYLNPDSPEHCDYREYGPEELTELYEELALYRIRGYELTVDSKSGALDDADLKLKYPRSIIRAKGFFRCYEETLKWSFDPELCENTLFDNYQRLVLQGSGYLDLEFYREILNTYEEDLAYVQYFEEVANKTKWIEDYLGDRTLEGRIEGVALMQALDIAAGFPNVPRLLVSYGFSEYMNSVRNDYSYKGLDCLFFEIWKRVAKSKMSFKEALLEIRSKDMFPSRSSEIKHELENTPNRFPLEDFYGSHVAVIDKMASDDKARQLISEAVVEKVKPKYYLDYARKKLDIAKDIYLIP